MKTRRKVRAFTRREGAPFAAEQTDLVGSELVKMAEAAAVDDVASLDPRETFESIYSDPSHPLRVVYGDFKDVDGAAREHWVRVTRQMLNSVHVVYVDMPAKAKPIPLVTYVPDARIRSSAGTTRGGRRVLSNDMLSHDPEFLSALKQKIHMVQNAVAGLGWIVRSRTPPATVGLLYDKLDAALRDYSDSIMPKDKAAE